VRRQVLRDALEQPLRNERDLVNRAFERLLVSCCRLPETADLPHELKSGGSDLFIGRDNVGVAQRLDASTHGANNDT